MMINNNILFENINLSTLIEMIKTDHELILLDVRTANEHKIGNIKNSINIDFLQNTFESLLNKLDREKAYLVYCRSGMRSAKAASLLINMGFRKVYNLKNGYNSWK
jgi:phage shock protein E